MVTSGGKTREERMTGKLRTIGITLFALVEYLQYNGVDLGVDQEDIYRGLEIVTGTVAIFGAAISWGKLIYRKLIKKMLSTKN